MGVLANSDALRLTGISKRFGGVRALHDVEMSVPRGEVHGLVGANGSGKSTLVKILAGYHGPDDGHVEIWGKDVPPPITDASRHGIATIHQDLGLIESLSIVENVVQTTRFGVEKGRPISWRQQRKRVAGLMDRLGIRLDPGTEIATLTRGERTLVAVARAICELEAGVVDDPEAEGRHLLIMDEPTAALSSTESGAVYELLRRVAAEGGAALFISHHVQEVRSLCTRITILRDGEVVGTVASAEATEADIVRGMLGAELARETPLDPEAAGRNGTQASSAVQPAAARQPVLRVQDLQTDILRGMSFDVQPGEIVGITGLLGMGQDELPYVIAGARTCLAGSIEVDGRTLASGRLADAIRAGVALVPAERRRDGLWMEASATENLGVARASRFWRHGRYDRARERAVARELADRFGLRPRDPSILTNALSGGNQQKVLLAKWLQLEPRVVLLHEPTQGVDIGAKLEIHRLVRTFAESAGAAVCVFSSDHVEVAELCDRAIVMSRGRVAGTIRRPELSTHRIVEMANEVTQS
jgi:ribose transport system ATP-binding protein